VSVEGPLDANGVVLDFDTLKQVVRTQIVERWDHSYLNDDVENPTAELLALRAWKLLTDSGLTLAALRLWETTDSWVDLTPGADPVVATGA
jgi:6-pyruvoyltetrahydropterin/6-carboxytetrahydropterin synthase